MTEPNKALSSYLGHDRPMWVRNEGMTCQYALSLSHGGPYGHDAKGMAYPRAFS